MLQRNIDYAEQEIILHPRPDLKQGQKVKVKINIKVTFCDLWYLRIHNVSIHINFYQN